MRAILAQAPSPRSAPPARHPSEDPLPPAHTPRRTPAMSLPSLNSVYLQSPPRRDDYRRARAVLLRARGDQTIIAEHAERQAPDKVCTKLDIAPRTRYLL